MIRARANRSENEVLCAASSDEESMDVGTSNPSDGFSSTLSRGRGRARGRARGARGQNSTARGSSRRGRGKKNLSVFVLQFLTFFSFKGDSLDASIKWKFATEALLLEKKPLLKYLWYPITYNWLPYKAEVVTFCCDWKENIMLPTCGSIVYS